VPLGGYWWEGVRVDSSSIERGPSAGLGWGGAIALAIVVNTAIEVCVLAKGFRLKLGPIRLFAFLAANAASVTMALFALPGR